MSLERKTLHIYMLLLIIITTSCKTIYSEKKEFPIYEKERILMLYEEDQNIQREILSNRDVTKSDSLRERKSEIFNKNNSIIKDLFNSYGIPLVLNDNDDKYQKAFWIIVQHADFDVAFQEEVLASMGKELANKKVNKKYYAYLFDRVRKNKGKKQLYGTQLVYDSLGNHKLYKIKNVSQLNKRRIKIGLTTIEEYLELF